MNTNTSFPLSVALFSMLPLAGCVAEDSLSNDDYDDIAVAVGTQLANDSGGEVGSIDDALSLAQTGSTSLTAAEGSGAHEVYVRAGLSYEYLVDCFDVDGNVLAACDDATNRAEVSVDWTGELDLPRYDATIVRSGEWVLDGIQGETAVLNGSGSFDLDTNFSAMYRDVERSMRLVYNAQYSDVQIDTATRRPVGGTVNYAIDGERFARRGVRTVEANFSVDAQVSFAADGTATLVLDGERTYVVDTGSGDIEVIEE